MLLRHYQFRPAVPHRPARHLQHQRRIVILGADMVKNHETELVMHEGRQKGGHILVGKMTHLPANALLKRERIGPFAQQFGTVIRLKNKRVRTLQSHTHQLRSVAQVGCDAQLGAIAAYRESDGIPCVVRDAETTDRKTVEPNRVARRETLDVGDIRHACGQALACSAGHENRYTELPRQYSQTLDMIAVFMSHKDRVEAIQAFPHEGGALLELSEAEAAVNQDLSAARDDQNGIAAAAAAQD